MKGEILVIRESDLFSGILIENDFSVINFPLIAIEPVEDLTALDRIIAEIENFDGIFITSPNAAAPFLERLGGKTFGGKIYVLGKRAWKLFDLAGIETVFYENAKNVLELLDSIPDVDLRGKRFLFLRGSRSLRVIPEKLKGLAEVEELVVYTTAATKADTELTEEIAEKLKNNEISAVCFFSPSGAESFLEQFDAAALHQTKIATIGKTTAEFFERRNFKVDFVSSKSSAEDFAVELIKFIKEN